MYSKTPRGSCSLPYWPARTSLVFFILAQRLFDSMIAGSELIHEVQPAIRKYLHLRACRVRSPSISTRTSAISCAHSAGT